MNMLHNSDDAKKMGKEGLSFKEAIVLIREFEEFNPNHILPKDKAKTYLDEHWEGRMLDIQHFGFKPRNKRREKGKEEQER